MRSIQKTTFQVDMRYYAVNDKRRYPFQS